MNLDDHLTVDQRNALVAAIAEYGVGYVAVQGEYLDMANMFDADGNLNKSPIPPAWLTALAEPCGTCGTCGGSELCERPSHNGIVHPGFDPCPDCSDGSALHEVTGECWACEGKKGRKRDSAWFPCGKCRGPRVSHARYAGSSGTVTIDRIKVEVLPVVDDGGELRDDMHIRLAMGDAWLTEPIERAGWIHNRITVIGDPKPGDYVLAATRKDQP